MISATAYNASKCRNSLLLPQCFTVSRRPNWFLFALALAVAARKQLISFCWFTSHSRQLSFFFSFAIHFWLGRKINNKMKVETGIHMHPQPGFALVIVIAQNFLRKFWFVCPFVFILDLLIQPYLENENKFTQSIQRDYLFHFIKIFQVKTKQNKFQTIWRDRKHNNHSNSNRIVQRKIKVLFKNKKKLK